MDSNVAEEYRCHARLVINGEPVGLRCPLSKFDHENGPWLNHSFKPVFEPVEPCPKPSDSA